MSEPGALLTALVQRCGKNNFRDTHQWSVTHPAEFWREAWNDLGIVGNQGSVDFGVAGFLDTQWFPDGHLNIVETLLEGDSDSVILVAWAEDAPRRSMTRQQLRDDVAACAEALRQSGVQAGDRVAAWMPNVPETVIFALGALAIGAVVSTASPDFGSAALVDRLAPIEPVMLLAAHNYRYSGKQFDMEEKVDTAIQELPSLHTIVTVGAASNRLTWSDWLAPHRGVPLTVTRFPFNHPGFILFSSGTTGRPKCIVHSAAAVLLKVLSEQGYHLDIRAGDRMLYVTTCGWMMWNWLLCGLGRGATIYLVDGSPGYPDLEHLWTIAAQEKLTFLGVSAALIDTWRRAGLRPKDDYELDSLRTLASTGSALAASGFDWVTDAVSPDIAVASIAGGTDLCGCLVLSVPTEPVTRGEIQGPALGLDVTVVRPDGSLADVGEDGELVCRTPFPTVPLSFWGDPDNARLTDAYFARFPGIWAHGDHARKTPSGGFEILGRLDATLNAKGVRIGTAEIYRVVLSLPEVRDAMAVAQPEGNDTRIVLFVVLDGELSDELSDRIRTALRSQASPRHVPSVIVAAPDLPRTRSGKLTELAVADIVAGRPVRDTSALANPECLGWFQEWTTRTTS